MSRTYGKVSISIWRSRRFTGLPNDEARMFYLYLHTRCAVSPESRHTQPIRRARPESAMYMRAAPEVRPHRLIDHLPWGLRA